MTVRLRWLFRTIRKAGQAPAVLSFFALAAFALTVSVPQVEAKAHKPVVVPATGFVTTQGHNFMLHGRRFRVAGVNNHYLVYGSHQEVTRVLDDAVAMHANVVRTFIQPIIGSLDGQMPTIWNWKSNADSSNLGVHGVFMASWDPAAKAMVVNTGPDGLERVDFLIHEASKRKLKLIIAFADFWAYTGGAQQISAWYGGTEREKSEFFGRDPRTRADYKRLVQTVLTRVNKLTHVPYKDDPTIFAWELMNEPDILPVSLLRDWIKEMAAYVKSIDAHHMLASGHSSLKTKLLELEIPEIDFGTWHGYPAYEKMTPEQFTAQIGDYCDLASAYGKPVILEEFGMARSNPVRPESYRTWLEKIRSNENCAGWVVWRLVAKQDNNQLPVDDHDQFDISNDGSPVWMVLKNGAFAVTASNEAPDAPITARKARAKCSKTLDTCP